MNSDPSVFSTKNGFFMLNESFPMAVLLIIEEMRYLDLDLDCLT